jgi:Flp pilus assembly protein TadG
MSRHAQRQNESGAAAVEFAIVLVPVLLVLFGIINFGLAFHRQIQLSGAAREGARTMAIKNDAGAVRPAVETAAPTLKPSRLGVSIEIIEPVAADCSPDSRAKVTVTYPFQFEYLFGSSTITLSGVGVMRCNG